MILDVGVELDTAEPATSCLRLKVSDTGLGFDLASHEKLFLLFERGEQPGSDATTGLGLGLAITRALVVAMGGENRVNSTLGVGSTFEVTLPQPSVPSTLALEPVEKPAANPESLLASRQQPLRVLLVEDHPINRRALTVMLEAIEADVEISINGREGVDAAARARFDVILMDLLMPVMDGFEASRAIRLHEARNGLPRTAIIMLTASALPSQAEKARQAGCDAHLTKPVTPVRLFEALTDVLGNTGDIAC